MLSMNLYQRALMDKPSLTPGHCVICGEPYPTEHHVVPRSQGGLHGPVLHLCGDGVRGHHGMAEAGLLRFRWDEKWQWHISSVPVKYESLPDSGWTPCSDAGVAEC